MRGFDAYSRNDSCECDCRACLITSCPNRIKFLHQRAVLNGQVFTVTNYPPNVNFIYDCDEQPDIA